MSDKDLTNLLNILHNIEKIQNYAAGIASPQQLEQDEKTFDAILMNFVAIGESINRLSDELKKENPQIPWKLIYALRNIIAHDYFGILAEEIWEIIENDLENFKKQILKLLN